MIQTLKKKVPTECANRRFDVAAAELFSEISRKKIKAIIDSGGAYLNQKRIKFAKNLVALGDSIELVYDEKTEPNKAVSGVKAQFPKLTANHIMKTTIF
jgi:23S rRNA-/tRNA-specific pseudouridylate synthase